MATTATVQFGKWMPDDDKNIEPGVPTMWLNSQRVNLDDAQNVLYTGASWRLFKPLVTSGTAVPATVRDACAVDDSGAQEVFCAAGGDLYHIVSGTPTQVSKSTGAYSGTAGWQFQAYGDCLMATNGVDPVQAWTIGTSSAFADLAGSPPIGSVIAIVRDFVVLGNLTYIDGPHTHRVQWSGLANATSWPTPLTQDARAAQSGYQDLYAEYGPVQYIAAGEEFGIIFQQRGIVRMRYVGGDVVFDFYTFERKRGLLTPRAAAQMGDTVFFLSGDGFYATDGNTVKPIGYGAVNLWFFAKCYDTSKVRAAVDSKTQCAYWSFPSTAGANDYVLVYNFQEDVWSYAVNTTVALFEGLSSSAHIPQAFDTTYKLGSFTGTQPAGEIQTKIFRLQSDMKSDVWSARVLADDVAQVAIAATQSDDDVQAFGSYVARETRTRKSSFRSNGYAHAFKVLLGSNTTYAQGVEIDFDPRSTQ